MNKKQQEVLANFAQTTIDLLFTLQPPGLNLDLINLLLSCGRMAEATEKIQAYTKQLMEVKK